MPQKIPKLQRQVGIQPVSSPDIAGATRQFAASTNYLSTVGSTMSQVANTQLAQKLGQEAGKNPQGELSAPITNFDQHFRRAYESQASSTLNLQAYEMMNDAHLEVSKSSEITPELLASYNQNVMKGLSGIIDKAPDSIKSQMQTKFGTQLIISNNKLQNKMIKDQQTRQKQTNLENAQASISQGYDLGLGGEEKTAIDFINQNTKHNRDSVATGNMTGKEAATNSEAVKKSTWSAIFIKRYRDAKENRNVNAFAKSMSGAPPKDDVGNGLDESTWEAVKKNLVTQIAQDDNLAKRENNALISQTKLEISTNPAYSTTDLSGVISNLPPKEGADLSLFYANNHEKAKELKNQTDFVAGNFQQGESFAQATPTLKNKAFEQNVQSLIDKEGMGRFEAEVHVAAFAGGAVQKFIASLNQKGKTANPQDLQDVGAAIHLISASGNVKNLEGLSKEARIASRKYREELNTHSPEEAASIANEAVYGKDLDDFEALNTALAVHRRTVITPQGNSFYQNLADVDPSTATNITQFKQYADDEFDTNFIISKGDTETAKKVAQDEIRASWSTTTLNGDKEFAYLPVDKLLNLPKGSNPFVYDDMVSQVMPQLEATKEAYKKGNSDFFWELKSRLTKDDAISANKQLSEETIGEKIGEFGKNIFGVGKIKGRFADLRRTIDDYKNQGPPILVKVNRDGTREDHQVIIRADPLLARSVNSAKPFVGGYNIQLKTGTGKGINDILRVDPIAGPIRYVPNKQKIMDGYNQFGSEFFVETTENIQQNIENIVLNRVAADRFIVGEDNAK